jgi:hypothetical protein
MTEETVKQPPVNPEQAAAEAQTTVNERPVLRHLFKNDEGITFIYDFDLLRIEQICLAEEVFEYKRQQINTPPRRFDEILTSGGGGYFYTALGYMLVKTIDGKPQKYEGLTSASEAVQFVSRLGGDDYSRLREVVNDFFTRIDRSKLASRVLQHNADPKLDELLASLVSQPTQTGSKKRREKDSFEKNISTILGNSGGG